MKAWEEDPETWALLQATQLKIRRRQLCVRRRGNLASEKEERKLRKPGEQ